MSYLRHWRRVHAEAAAIVCDSSDDSSENESNEDNVEPNNREPSHSNSPPSISDSESDTGSDFGYNQQPFSSSDSDSGEQSVQESEDKESLTDRLAAWGTRNKCTRACTDELLTVLREEGVPVPKDSRTLLRTPKHVDPITKCGGQYIYFGIEKGIRKILDDNETFFTENQDCIRLLVNIEGVPLYKSSSTQFWPILCSFGNFKPFLVALFYGNSKPSSVTEYLSDFLEEIVHLKRGNVKWENLTFQVDLRAFVCDAPARCFLKCTKGHACERCIIKGYWKSNRVILHSTIPFSRRTDDEFSAFIYQTHQVTRSPLIDHGLKCVSGFCLDYMHLVCLGVVKRLITFLKQGPAGCRLSYQQLLEVLGTLQSFSGKLQSEFARQPRSIFEIERWKAAEFRQFLLYTGPVALKKVVSKETYDHFLTLTVAISILLP